MKTVWLTIVSIILAPFVAALLLEIISLLFRRCLSFVPRLCKPICCLLGRDAMDRTHAFFVWAVDRWRLSDGIGRGDCGLQISLMIIYPV